MNKCEPDLSKGNKKDKINTCEVELIKLKK